MPVEQIWGRIGIVLLVLYCPTITSFQLEGKICGSCKHNFATEKFATAHMTSLGHRLNKRQKNRKINSNKAARDSEVLCGIRHEENYLEGVRWVKRSAIEDGTV